MKNLSQYVLAEGRTDYIDTCDQVKDALKDMNCPKGGEKSFIELSDNRKICIYNDDKSVYKSISAILMRDNKIVDGTREGFFYGKEYMSGKNVSPEEAFDKLKQRLSKNNIDIYDK